MTEFKIAELAQSKGLRNSYELAKALDTSDRTASRLWKGQMSSISRATINLLCSKLGCLPQDFITYTPEKKKRK